MATIGREAARAPLTSADINDGIVGAADLQSTLDLSSKTITLGTPTANAVTISPSSGDAKLTLTSNGSQPWEVYSPDSSNDLRFKSDSTDYVTIDTSGKLGIGTTSPQAKLDVSDVGNFSTGYNTFSGDGLHIQCTGTAGDGSYAGGISFSRISADNNSRAAGISAVQTETDADRVGLAFFTHNSNTTANALVEAMRIDSDGKVGINTDSPGGRLSVRGTSGLGISDSHLAFGTNQDAYITTGASGIVVFREHDGSSTNTERVRIDASGNLLVGTTNNSPVGNNVVGAGLLPNGSAQLSRDANPALFLNRKTSDGDLASFRKDGTTIGTIGIKTSRLFFATTGASGIAMSGVNLLPTNGSGTANDNTNDIGFSSFRFDDIYATNGTIQTSDANEKQDIAELDEAERRVAVAAKGLLRKFRWKDSVAKKGDDARTHFGIIAQDLQAAFEAEGLDAGRYAMFIHSTWTDEETGEERSRMGVRYPELLAFIIAAL